MLSLKYLLTCRNFIFLAILFSFIDNFGMDEKSVEKNSDYPFTVVFLGNAGVGKTSICSIINNYNFDEGYDASSNISTFKKEISYMDKTITIPIYDSPGQKKYNAVAQTLYSEAHLVVLVYAINDKNSFENIQNWFKEVKNRNQTAIFFLVGNKTDLKGSRVVPTEEAKKYATENKMKFFEISAKIKDNIFEMFYNSITYLPVFENDKNKEDLAKYLQLKNATLNVNDFQKKENEEFIKDFEKNKKKEIKDNNNPENNFQNKPSFFDKYCNCFQNC